MSRTFPVLFDINEEDKVIGGYLTIKQGIYAVLFGVAAFCSLLLPIGGSLVEIFLGKVSIIVIIIKIVFAILFIIFGLFFMFRHPYGMSYNEYLKHLIKFHVFNRRKIHIND